MGKITSSLHFYGRSFSPTLFLEVEKKAVFYDKKWWKK